jgi:lysozyme family protein
MDEAGLKKLNAARWNTAQLTRPFKATAMRILANKGKYKAIEAITSVPWWIVGVIDYRECNLDPNLGLAQGDPWRFKSRNEPITPPFNSWKDAAIYALEKSPPFLSRWGDWSVGGALTATALYNGIGMEARGLPESYVWSGTTIYDPPTGRGGKYVSDHLFDYKIVDKQLGAAGLIKAMMALDKTIKFDGPSVTKKVTTGAVIAAGTAAAAQAQGVSMLTILIVAAVAGAAGYLIAHYGAANIVAKAKALLQKK